MALSWIRMESAGRRLSVLKRILTGPIKIKKRLCSTGESGGNITIGDVTVPLRTPLNPELVPVNYFKDATDLPQYVLRQLRWMAQKDQLCQDIFLIGPPGPFRRTLAMQYLQMVNREMEYVCLSRDTTESDLKQRREITNGTAHYVDQCAVTAAINGRVLVIDGIEKAERNVLPVINNLLENREMQLEDGRFLMAASRYDKLLKGNSGTEIKGNIPEPVNWRVKMMPYSERGGLNLFDLSHSKEKLDGWNLVRVSEDFRVVALGLPVPRYRGHPLDPPLRSRFQGRDVGRLPFHELSQLLRENTTVSDENITRMLSFAYMFVSKEAENLGLPDFPIHSLIPVMQLMEKFPGIPPLELVHRIYPYSLFTTNENQTAVEDALKKFHLVSGSMQTADIVNAATSESLYKFVDIANQETHGSENEHANLRFKASNKSAHIMTTAGQNVKGLTDGSSKEFILTKTHHAVLSQMLQSHLVGDFCIIGGKGSGKSSLAKEFARILGYNIEPYVLYQDITSRELLQQRSTLDNGDTVWRSSPLVNAALEGKLLVLDGIHRVDAGTLAVLHRLCHDREIHLYDGTRLLSQTKYNKLKEENSYSDETMISRGLKCIHPSFRIIALAEPPETSGGHSKRWLDAELLSLFMYHRLRQLELNEELYILRQLGINVCSKVENLLNITHMLRNSSDPALKSLSGSLSTRQLIRLCRRINSYKDDSIHHLVQNACLSRFLPTLTKTTFDSVLQQFTDTRTSTKNARQQFNEKSDEAITSEIKNGVVRIGRTSVPLYLTKSPSKVPDVIFYDIPQHLTAMESMLKDFLLGEHLLLIGNQGVGKNKIADRFLQLLNRPREYIQLHRDTTIQTLTLQPTVQDGVIVYEDSPLVRALKLGHILVVDEADKAPAHVVCILKTLLESGEMLLSDGRRVLMEKFANQIPTSEKDKYVIMHPDFRLIVLANRPGFPFLGNDFYRALGDIFACHPIDNPDFYSEMAMLRQYGPDVSENVLAKLTRAFGELRTMADSGLLTYPYSIREAVNVVRHIQKFPNDSLSSVIRNIFDFDSYGKETVETLQKVLKKHGVPFGVVIPEVHLSSEYELEDLKLEAKWKKSERVFENVNIAIKESPLQFKGPNMIKKNTAPLEKIDHRSTKFSELHYSWKLPMHYTNIVSNVAVRQETSPDKSFKEMSVHVATSNPVQIYSFKTTSPEVTCLDLSNYFPLIRRGTFKPRMHIAASGNSSDVFLFDEMSGTKVLVNPANATVSKIEEGFNIFNTAEVFIHRIAGREENSYVLCSHLAEDQIFFTYRPRTEVIERFDLKDGKYMSIHLPFKVVSAHPLSKETLLVVVENQRKFIVTTSKSSTNAVIHDVDDMNNSIVFEDVMPKAMNPDVVARAIGKESLTGTALPINRPNTYASLVTGLSDNFETADIYGISRNPDYHVNLRNDMKHGFSSAFAVVPSDATFIRAQPQMNAPPDANPKGMDVNFLEVVDICNKHVRFIPVEKPTVTSPYAPWLSTRQDTGLVLCPTGDGGVIVSDIGGTVHLYEIGSAQLQHSLAEWRKMLGDAEQRHLQVTINRKSTKSTTAPKFGKIDPKNAPHVGGNTWAGGTGGRDTAGLGGMGGPFRLDAGHTVHQVSEIDKASVPEEVLKAAREMGKKAHAERLREIKMSKYDAEEYEKLSSSIRPQVKLLRVMLDTLQAKGKERQWLHHKTTGEIDDIKIVEGLTGEHNVYKRRGEQEPEAGSPQQLPKRLKLLVDVSGSMYRFNGYDGRLERILEAALMVMEAFENYEHKFKYEIIGHSGDDYDASFVRATDAPQNNKERMDILKSMHAHAQFCASGDNTLEATKYAIKKILEDKADEYFVIVLSDANFDRYGIPAEYFARLLSSEPRVNAYAVFIGSLGDQAERLKENLPPGHAFVCLDTAEIPGALRQIFTSTMLNASTE